MTIKNKKGTELTISASGIDTFNDLARRAVACKGWRWMPGMRWSTQTSLGRSHQRILDHEIDDFPPHLGCVPDLNDPATLGGLLALVREAWGDPLICVAVDNTGAGWWVDGWAAARPQVPCDLHPTEAEALVAALEAAP